MSEELAARLVRRSAIQRDERHGRAPAWAMTAPPGLPGGPGKPVVVHGELPEGYPWALVFGLDLEGPAADIAVHTPSSNIGIAHNRATGAHRHRGGAANSHSAGVGRGHHHVWVWITHDDTTAIELLTSTGDLLAAIAVQHDPVLRVRGLPRSHRRPEHHAACCQHLDPSGHELAREDLTDLAASIED